MEYVVAIIIFAVVITLLVFIHEFGHFIAAKKNGVKVEEFAIGMGPKMFSFKKGETLYALRLFPIGGYVSMLGQDDFDHSKNQDPTKKTDLDPRSYAFKSPWQRAAIVAMGVVMNFLGAIIIYTVIGFFSNFTFLFPQVPTFPPNKYPFGDQRDAAYVARSINKEGDKIPERIAITRIGDIKYDGYDAFERLINQNLNKEIEISYTSALGGKEKIFKITPQSNFQKAVVVATFSKDSAAEQAGMKSNDLILKMNGKSYSGTDDFRNFINQNKEQEITFETINLLDGSKKQYKFSPKLDASDNKYKIGAYLAVYGVIPTVSGDFIAFDGTTVNVREYQGFGKIFAGVGETINLSQYTLSLLGQSISKSFQEKNIQPVADAASGPVGVFVTVKTLWEILGIFGIVQLMAIINLSLGVFNLLPIPGLDGWHLYNNLIEGLTGKRLPSKVFNVVTIIGFALLLIMMLLITVKDLFTYIHF